MHYEIGRHTIGGISGIILLWAIAYYIVPEVLGFREIKLVLALASIITFVIAIILDIKPH